MIRVAYIFGVGAGLPPLVQDIGICLVAAIGLALVCERIRLPHSIGFIAAGMLVGPSGIEAVSNPDDVRVLAELGIVLLLFLVGVELDFRAIAGRRRVLLVAGGLQVPLTICIALLAWSGAVHGFGWSDSAMTIVYLAVVCAFSSTLLVVQALERAGAMASSVGALCVGLLLAQDLWALLVLAMQPAERPEFATLAAPLFGTLGLAAGVFIVGRIALSPMVTMLQGQPEFLGLAALGWCMTCALIASRLEALTTMTGSPVSLSSGAGMGAFLAGVTLASVPGARDLVRWLVGLRDFFVLFFFVSLGMAIPRPIDAHHVGIAVLLILVVLASRAAVMYPLLSLARTGQRVAKAVTLQMTQISEFALVIVWLGYELGHLDKDLVTSVLLAFIALTMATPIFTAWAAKAYALVEADEDEDEESSMTSTNESDGHRGFLEAARRRKNADP